jgi:hypothetical protein
LDSNLNWFLFFSHKFCKGIQSWNSTTIVVIIIGVKGRGDNKMKKIDDYRWKGQIWPKCSYYGEQFFEAYNEGYCVLFFNNQ